MSAAKLEFHHIGVACADLDATRARYACLGYSIESPVFEDPVQSIRGQFLAGPGTRIELVAPLSAESPVSGWIARGVHLYHTAYLTANLAASIAMARREMRAKIVVEPVPAVAFDGRRIAFLLAPGAMLIELIEA